MKVSYKSLMVSREIRQWIGILLTLGSAGIYARWLYRMDPDAQAKVAAKKEAIKDKFSSLKYKRAANRR